MFSKFTKIFFVVFPARKATLSVAGGLFFCFLVFSPVVSQAQFGTLLPDPTGPVPTNINSELQKRCDAGDCGNYVLNDFVRIFTGYARNVLGIVGAVALLFFVYGGVKMIISAGSSEKIEEAKTVVRNAVIGLAIVFVSWTIINFVVVSLGYDASTFGAWFEAP